MAGTFGMSVNSGGSLTDRSGSKVWDVARSLDPTFTCANLFWWYNMLLGGLCSPPRPISRGQKIPDIYAQPGELRSATQAELGQFPYSISGVPTHQFVAASGLQRQQSGLNNTTADSVASLAISTIAYSGLVPIRTKLQGIYKRCAVCVAI